MTKKTSKMTKNKLTVKLLNSKGYLRWSDTRLSSHFNLSTKTISKIKKSVKAYLTSRGITY